METATTTATRATRTRRCLGILLALPRDDAPDGAAVEFELHLIVDAEGDGMLVEAGDGPVKPARRHDAVALLDRRQHPLPLLLLLLLRAEQEEIEDGEHRRHHDDRGQHALHAAARRRRRGVREIGKKHEASGLHGALVARNFWG